jgi:sulfate/thiosulfate transport system substrate-binding protein
VTGVPPPRRRRWTLFALVPGVALIAALAALTGCGGEGGGGGQPHLTLVGYSVAREVYADLVPGFQATPAGAGVDVDQSYGASGEQSRAVADGLGADIVALSLEPDVTRLVEAGLVDTGWNAGAHRGIVSNSVVVFVTRSGNPKGIAGWPDLIADGVEVITPNPLTSGAAQWNVLAAYGAASDVGADEAAGLSYIDALFRHVPVQPASAREALQIFAAGKGDVLLSYENEAIAARAAGQELDYLVPDDTILIQNPAAVVNTTANPRSARAFVEYLHSAAAQRILGAHGYRPTDAAVAATFAFPTPRGLFTIADLGGWPALRQELFDPENGKLTEIFEGRGRGTGE